MSLRRFETFGCPYCMSINDIIIDEISDVNQQQIIDCQICCAPIEIFIEKTEFGLRVHARRDDE